MHKTVIVMRHGKAKRPAEGQDDIERELTEAGRRSLKATLGASLALWQRDGGRVEVWSSPAVRAQQTAELLARALRKRGIPAEREVKIVESLWAGDMAATLADVRASDADTVALVGHNPFSEEFVRRLTGSDIRFATGALAAIELAACDPAADGGDSPDPGNRLLWFAQGPVSQRWKTLVAMEKALSEAAGTVRRRYDAFLSDPDDIETMHALRVSIRTARSLVAFAKPWQNAKQNARIQEDLRDVVRLTSRQRELDVMWSQVEGDDSLSPELADFCAQQAATERARVLGELGSSRVRKRLDRATGELESVRWNRRRVRDGLDASEVRERFDRMADGLGADVASLDLSDVERTHDVRKQAKRVRYSAERFKDILGEDAVAIAKDMVAHQDALGAVCDARVNIGIINDLAAAELPDPIAWELALLRAKYETFLYTTLRDTRAHAHNTHLRL